MNKTKNIVKVLFLLLAINIIAGCSYSSRSILKQNVNTVYIPILDNQTFRRGMEYELTKAIKNEIMFKTQLRIVNKNTADSLLEGEIVSFTEQTMIVDADDRIVEGRIFITVNFSWKDLRTDRLLVDGKDVIGTTEFVVDRGETIMTAKNEAYTDIAEKMVDQMNERW